MHREEVSRDLERRFDEPLRRWLNVDALLYPSLHTGDFRNPDQPGSQALVDLDHKGLAPASRGTLPNHSFQCRPVLIVSLAS